jgi:excisionase family DNA binding protein
MDALLLTPVEAARVLGIGRTKVYELIAAGRLRSVRLDGCRRITRDDLAEFVGRLRDEAAA